MSNKDVKFSLKVVMNEQNTKVLFAEAGNDFANVLLSFLTLPLGRIVRLLQEQYGADEAPAIGSLTTLYNGLANLDVANFTEEGVKQMLLDPKRSCDPVKYFCCENRYCVNSKKSNMSLYHGIARCDCGELITREVHSSGHESESDDDVGGVFAASGATFVVSDDLRVLPDVPGSVIQILRIADADFGNMQNLTFDFKEIMDFLKGLFLSRTPLTDVVLNNGKINFATPSEPKILLPEVEKKSYSSTSGKMTLKVTLQTSTNKLLFAQAESKSEFIQVLFSLLTIPLGGVVCLLNGDTTIENIDNLYKSVVEHIDGKYFESARAQCILVVPKVPHGYMLANQILGVEEEKACKIYYYRGRGTDDDDDDDFVSLTHSMGGSCVKVTDFKFPTGYSYVKGPKLFMIYDDLTVEPSGMMSYLSKLRTLKIPLSDVNELELHIGLEEVLSIFRAALVSKCALSYGLSPLLTKQPKQEH